MNGAKGKNMPARLEALSAKVLLPKVLVDGLSSLKLLGDRRRHADARAPGAVGKLAVRGPTGCRYLDDARQTTYVRDGWNLTGDAFSMDADGYFWFQARTDDMIISSGYNIAGSEVEAALLEHPAVAECAVVGAPDAERGHVVKAFVVLAGDRRGACRGCKTSSRR